jgi:hypothetical protein
MKRSLVLPTAAGALAGGLMVGFAIDNPMLGLAVGLVLALVIVGVSWVIRRASRR